MNRNNQLLILLLFIGHVSLTAQSADYQFEENNGLVSVEAEHFASQELTDTRRWELTTTDRSPEASSDGDEPHTTGASGDAYLETLPDTRRNHGEKLIHGENFSNQPGKLGVLHYRVYFNNPGKYYVWVRAYSSGSEDNGIHVGLNGEWPESGQRMQWCEGKNAWTWASKQRTQRVHCGVEQLIYLQIPETGWHTVSFSMREDGFEFDKFVLSRDYAAPYGTGPAETVYGQSAEDSADIQGELKKWHKVTLNFDGPESDEQATDNPFLNYRLNVVFSNGDRRYLVPGYFAADGNAGSTSSTDGNRWRVHFAPDAEGEWTYQVSFKKGENIAVDEAEDAGSSAGFMDGTAGSFTVGPTDKTGRDFRAHGRLQYVGEPYLKFAETGAYFLKAGADAPENFLSYVEFDGDFKTDGHKDQWLKTWEAHIKDWQAGDPEWQNGKGKGIIGAINYLAGKGMNVFSFLTCNIKGDDQNVFPYLSYDDLDRIDISRMDQWEMVFQHAQRLGMFLHFKTLEVENQGLHDGGALGPQRKLYYRELIARFGHHLALNWNLCEENGKWKAKNPTPEQYTPERIAMTEYFYRNDPYHHHLVIHNGIHFDDLLGDRSRLTGASVQTHHANFDMVHREVLRWRKLSTYCGKPWVICVDEPGDAQHSLLPDAEDPGHDVPRKNALWGTLMAGGAGIEWYFGYDHAHSDLSCQDWRSRDKMWDQSRYALQFFNDNELPFWKMIPDDEFTDREDDYVFYLPGEVYVFYLKEGGALEGIDMRAQGGDYEVSWYNPRTGQFVGEPIIRTGYSRIDLPEPPEAVDQDWVVLMKKR
ncbi:DUF5060 domain-containing protein [Flavilitoribacter nigricans]|uniref:DUF5060 domain-containing protein n=1 Tax=Flavilitoribacter nigricans (strain ATCC 23147 / DSM 23189 / NBRC 102662 / NCIMB 1420 / SS-2) TaxID=1122177 RepID=A0A2D0N0T4_FLAN2|nr:DUF5060 domain-containing protein [Flavilitoribacter nigricans]PHN02124.1 DUF5060 domain-containing protein [Flavilitoribacter nigricans DSM 23189 = NBRC 102662]